MRGQSLCAIGALLSLCLAAVGCGNFGSTRLAVAPRAPNSALLLLRIDSAISESDSVQVTLNGGQPIELTTYSYKVVHLPPGAYEVGYTYRYARKNGETRTQSFSGEIRPGTLNMVEMSQNFGNWHGSLRFFTRNRFTALRRLTNGGEVDLTGTSGLSQLK